MNNPLNTVERGNNFRDRVDALMSAAGFRTQRETREIHKKVDVSAVWLRDDFDGVSRTLVEAKDYSGTLDKNECIKFVHEYRPLIENKRAEKAWLVSRGEISPDGRALVDETPNLKCFTFRDLQRTLWKIDSYLHDLILLKDTKRLDEYYVPVKEVGGADLEDQIIRWIDDVHDPKPIAVVGGYGKGKSTFALHLAARLASDALKDPVKRCPILVPLGDVVDDLSPEGLIAKILASQHRVQNYHFSLFSTLNREGCFTLIFDGFDEMKHGMTFHAFERSIAKLLTFQNPNSKIIILGRDTAFHDSVEFRAIIEGKQFTAGGSVVDARDRTAFRHIEIDDFSIEETKRYIDRYFPIQAAESGIDVRAEDQWIEVRKQELLNPKFHDLIKRPVHAQMLCQIGTQKDVDLTEISHFKLYDLFVHYLVDREIQKPGRDPRFDLAKRRAFNASVAWWLWDEGRVSTTSLSEIPAALSNDIVLSESIDLDQIALMRELTAGCLIEKAADTVYFGHRSIQEFLVAERLFNTNFHGWSHLSSGKVKDIISLLNDEIINFIIGRIDHDDDAKRISLDWIELLEVLKEKDVPLHYLKLFCDLIAIHGTQDKDMFRGPWFYWLSAISSFKDGVVATDDLAAINRILYVIVQGLESKRSEFEASAIYLFSYLVARNPELDRILMSTVIASWLPVTEIISSLGAANKSRSAVINVNKQEQFLYWAFLKNAEIRREGREAYIFLNIAGLLDDTADMLGRGFTHPGREDGHTAFETSCSAQELYRAFADRELPSGQLDSMRSFINNEEVRKRIRPLTIERRSISDSVEPRIRKRQG